MKRAGFDIIFPDYWGDCSNTCNFGNLGEACPAGKKWSDGGLEKIVEGLENLDTAEIDHPLIGMFYDTYANVIQSCTCEHQSGSCDAQKTNLSLTGNQDVFYQMIKNFYSKIPEKYVAKIGQRYPVWLYQSAFFSNIDCSVFETARNKFRQDFGKELMIIAHPGFCEKDMDMIGIYGGVSSPYYGYWNNASVKLDIPSVMAGYDQTNITTQYGCGGRQPLVLDRKNGKTYTDNWSKAIASNEGWISIGGGWDELHEGSDIMATEQFGTKYIELTNQKVKSFKGNAPNWVECVMDDECVKNCVKYQCVSNHCSSNVIQSDVCPVLPVQQSAQFISQNVPAAMTVGQTYPVSITMKNNGTAAWVKASKYRLGEQGAHSWGISRVELASDVAGGSPNTFTFNVKAPTTPGTYNFQWQMVQESIRWFGDKTTNVAITVTAANQICTPNAVSGCKVCKSNGSAWVDTDSKCAANQTCQAGICVNQSTCANECLKNLKRCAADNKVQTCGNYDTDTCTEWGGDAACATNKKCLAGYCFTMGNNNIFRIELLDYINQLKQQLQNLNQ